MKRIHVLTVLGAIMAMSSALAGAQAQISTKAQQAATDALDAKTPKLKYKEEVLQLAVPGQTMGETVGVDVDSKNNIYVYSRTNPQGIARGGTAAMLWEFSPSGKFMREIGPNNYAKSFAHSVRLDKNDNIWQVDEGSGMIVKYNQAGIPVEQFGRTPEAIDYLEQMLEKRGRGYEGDARNEGKPKDIKWLHPDGGIGTFNRPTDVNWDSKGNIFVTDGYGNSRLVKIAPGGHWLGTVGTWGTGPNQFNIIHSVAVDSKDNIYAADRNNHRIQVYDDNLKFEKSITDIGAPWGLCIPKPDASGKQYLFSSDGTSGKLYKVDPVSGKVVGWAQTSLGRGEDDAGRLIHEIGCKEPNVVYLGSAILWNVTKITIQ